MIANSLGPGQRIVLGRGTYEFERKDREKVHVQLVAGSGKPDEVLDLTEEVDLVTQKPAAGG